MEEALGEIVSARGTRFDPDVVDACVRLLREKRFELLPEGERHAGGWEPLYGSSEGTAGHPQ